MALNRVKVWIAEILTFAELNAEFDNIINNSEDLGWPATKAKDLDGNQLILDGDQDTHITADTDDRIDFAAGGFDAVRIDGTTASSVNGLDLVTTATGISPRITARGESNIGINLFDSNGNELVELLSNASAVNQVRLQNSATGAAPIIQAAGESDIGFQILDSNGNQLTLWAAVASAVNEITITNAATGNPVSIAATGGDSDIGVNLTPKGTGQVDIGSGGATQTEMEAGSAADRIVTPAIQHYHPGHPKAWVKGTIADATLAASYGVTSITDNGTGDFTVTWSTAFTNAQYHAQANVLLNQLDVARIISIKTQANTSVQVIMGTVELVTEGTITASESNIPHFFVVAHGDQ